MADLTFEVAGEDILPGEAYLADTPALRGQAGTQPDLFLRWNRVPLAAATVDVVGPLYATKTEVGTKFREIVATEGVPAAVRWRSAQFRE